MQKSYTKKLKNERKSTSFILIKQSAEKKC